MDTTVNDLLPKDGLNIGNIENNNHIIGVNVFSDKELVVQCQTIISQKDKLIEDLQNTILTLNKIIEKVSIMNG